MTATPASATVGIVPPDHWDALLAFYRAHLTNGERVAEAFEWQQQFRAASGGNLPFAAWVGERLLGTVNLVPSILQGRAGRWDFWWYTDTIVAPEAPRGGNTSGPRPSSGSSTRGP